METDNSFVPSIFFPSGLIAGVLLDILQGPAVAAVAVAEDNVITMLCHEGGSAALGSRCEEWPQHVPLTTHRVREMEVMMMVGFSGPHLPPSVCLTIVIMCARYGQDCSLFFPRSGMSLSMLPSRNTQSLLNYSFCIPFMLGKLISIQELHRLPTPEAPGTQMWPSTQTRCQCGCPPAAQGRKAHPRAEELKGQQPQPGGKLGR